MRVGATPLYGMVTLFGGFMGFFFLKINKNLSKGDMIVLHKIIHVQRTWVDIFFPPFVTTPELRVIQ